MDMLADTHVHLHPAFDIDRTLDSAAENFDRADPGLPSSARMDVLCLTDSAGHRSDRDLLESIRPAAAWRFSPVPDSSGACAERSDGRRIYLLPGFQIISTENLEILALDCRCPQPDREADLSTLIDRILTCGGIPVLPWGFGKWTGARGEAVRQLIDSRQDFYLADNGNRLRGTRLPALLAQGRDQGLPLLTGSDPLPLPSQYARAGACGIRAGLPKDESDPSRAFRQVLDARAWSTFGTLVPLGSFVFNQVAMQIRKRIARPA